MQEFKTSGSSNTDTSKVVGSLETKYKRPEYGLTFTEKWNTDNTLGTEITVEDQVRKAVQCLVQWLFLFFHNVIGVSLLFFSDCQGTQADFWHNLLTKHRVRSLLNGWLLKNGYIDWGYFSTTNICATFCSPLWIWKPDLCCTGFMS